MRVRLRVARGGLDIMTPATRLYRIPAPVLSSWRRVALSDVRMVVLAVVLACAVLTTATALNSFAAENIEYVAKGGGGSARRQIVYIACMVVTLLATRPLERPDRLLPFPPRLFALFAFCLLSLSWSLSPGVGIRRLVLTFIVVWLPFRIVDELGYRRALGVMVAVLVGVLLADYLAILLTGAAKHQGGSGEGGLAGNWRGIMPHKNVTGPVTAITLLLLVFGQGRMPRWIRLLLIVAAAFFLMRTQSKTSIGLSAAGIVAGALYLRYNPAYRLLLAPLLMVLCAGLTYAAVTYLPSMLSALDSSQDAFTGRIQIWQTMIAYIRDHPWWGAGFGSFWDSGPVSPANIYGRSWVSAMVSQGHNGYLDLWTQIGIFGLILAVLVLFVVPVAKLLIARFTPRLPGAALLAILLFMFGHNFTETTMFTRDYFGNLMLAFVLACVENMVRHHRLPLLVPPPGHIQRPRRP